MLRNVPKEIVFHIYSFLEIRDMTTILMMMRMSCLISHAPVTEFWKYFPCRIDSMTLWCSLWKYLPPSVCFQSLEFSFLCDNIDHGPVMNGKINGYGEEKD